MLPKYLGSFEPENGKGSTIGNHLYQNIQNRQSTESLRLLGMDGTAANTGPHRYRSCAFFVDQTGFLDMVFHWKPC